jgi:hypothetical protein
VRQGLCAPWLLQRGWHETKVSQSLSCRVEGCSWCGAGQVQRQGHARGMCWPVLQGWCQCFAGGTQMPSSSTWLASLHNVHRLETHKGVRLILVQTVSAPHALQLLASSGLWVLALAALRAGYAAAASSRCSTWQDLLWAVELWMAMLQGGPDNQCCLPARLLPVPLETPGAQKKSERTACKVPAMLLEGCRPPSLARLSGIHPAGATERLSRLTALGGWQPILTLHSEHAPEVHSPVTGPALIGFQYKASGPNQAPTLQTHLAFCPKY